MPTRSKEVTERDLKVAIAFAVRRNANSPGKQAQHNQQSGWPSRRITTNSGWIRHAFPIFFRDPQLLLAGQAWGHFFRPNSHAANFALLAEYGTSFSSRQADSPLKSRKSLSRLVFVPRLRVRWISIICTYVHLHREWPTMATRGCGSQFDPVKQR